MRPRPGGAALFFGGAAGRFYWRRSRPEKGRGRRSGGFPRFP